MIENLIPYLQLMLALVSVLVYFAYTFGRDFFTPGKKISADLALALEKLREVKATGVYTDLDGIRENTMVGGLF